MGRRGSSAGEMWGDGVDIPVALALDAVAVSSSALKTCCLTAADPA